MRDCLLVVGLFVVLGLVAPGQAQQSETAQKKKTVKATPTQIEKWIRDLSSKRYVTREKAKFQLEKLGTAALEGLKQATKSEDMQTRQVANQLIEKIEQSLATDKLLAPTMVRVVCQDTPVNEAIAQLAKQSGYKIALQGNPKDLASRKITLDTGKTTFWKAFDQICQAGGLVEVDPKQGPAGAETPGFPGGGIPGGVAPGIGPVPVPVPAIRPNIFQGVKKPAQMKKALERIEKLLQQRMKAMQLQPGVPANAAQFQKMIQEMQKKQVQEMKKMVDQLRKEAIQQRQKAEKDQRKAIQRQQQPKAQPKKPENGPPAVAAPAQIKFNVGGIQLQGKNFPQFPVAQVVAPGFPGRQIGSPSGSSSSIRLKVGKAPKYPTSYIGAVRIQAISAKAEKDAYVVSLRCTAEPRLGDLNVLPTPVIDKAIDDLGQELRLAKVKAKTEPAAIEDPRIGGSIIPSPPRGVANNDLLIRFEKAEKASKSLAKLTGKIKVKVWRPAQPLVVVKDVMKSSGKTFAAKDGRKMTITRVSEVRNNRVSITAELPPTQGANNGGINGVVFGGGRVVIRGGANVIINGRRLNIGAGNKDTLDVYDAQGNKLQIVGRGTYTTIRNNQVSMGQSLTVSVGNGQGMPTKLVWSGRSQDALEIPFTLKTIPLD
ncbi:MAG: hypothetical protein ACFCD0_02890 [Gemmataceae bacterium]